MTNTIIKIIGVLITVLLLALYDYLPKNTVDLYPSLTKSTQAATDTWSGGRSFLTWHSDFPLGWTCHLRESDVYPYCGMYVTWSKKRPFSSLNLSDFSAFRFQLEYQGEAEYLQLFFRNAYDIADSKDLMATSKYASVGIHINDLVQPVVIPFDDFRVADWWILNHNISPQDIRTEVDDVIAVGIDFRAPLVVGDHQFTLHSVTAVGNYIAKETMYFFIVIFWASYIFIEMLVRFIRLNQQERLNQVKIGKLLAQSKDYKKQSETDNLTGAFNRHGLARAVGRLEKKRSIHKYSILLFDIDHFKSINDQFGHQAGDAALRELSIQIKGAIRSYDVFVRWGGEEFVLLYRNKDDTSSFIFAEKIRQVVEGRIFGEGKLPKLTVSIGVTSFLAGENFNSAMERADAALYEAKEKGRNQTVVR